MRLNIQLFGGRGASSSNTGNALFTALSDADAKSYNLTPEQLKQYNRAIGYLNLALSSKDAKDYYIKDTTRGFESRNDYQEIIRREEQNFDNSNWAKESYQKSLREAKTQNIVLTSGVSSSTLRALEKKGLIEIINDGGRFADKIRILRRK